MLSSKIAQFQKIRFDKIRLAGDCSVKQEHCSISKD